MAYSSILGPDHAPGQPSGRDAQSLGPSDNSDTGSDAAGTGEAYGDSDSGGTGERGSVTPGEAREDRDILPDHVVRMDAEAEEEEGGEEGRDALAGVEDLPAAEPEPQETTDLDADSEEQSQR
jgi:hypothetical protein